MIGVAVGSQSWKLVMAGDAEPIEVPCSTSGLNQVLALSVNGSGACPVLVAGNRRWAKVLAYGLKKHEIEVRYLGGPDRKRGQRIDNVKILKVALEKGFAGQPFFRSDSPNGEKRDEAAHPWIEMANAYELTNDEVRRAKHRVLDSLRILFPELLSLEEKLWRRKSLEALKEEKWLYFAEFGKSDYDFRDSLRHFVPASEIEEASVALKSALELLDQADGKKAQAKDKILRAVGDHPVANRYNESFSAMMVTLLVGWRNWGRNKKGWRWLRSYAGFAVTRMDAKGKMRISRKRPRIRVNLYHLMKSTRGKEVIGEAMTRLGKQKMRRMERMEYILKDIWRILRDSQIAAPTPAPVS